MCEGRYNAMQTSSKHENEIVCESSLTWIPPGLCRADNASGVDCGISSARFPHTRLTSQTRPRGLKQPWIKDDPALCSDFSETRSVTRYRSVGA